MTSTLNRNRANNSLARVPQIKHRRSVFGMNKSRKQTFKAGYLIPIFFEEVLPGDTWEINLSAFIRLLPQVAPPMDNLTVSTFFFFDPLRLEWENFTKQHGERQNPNSSIDYISPSITVPSGGFKAKSLQDYLGKPIGVDIKTTCFGERMYNRIWNAYFRSEWLQDAVAENTGDSDDAYTDYTLLKIGKMHDYFTDALPTILPNGEQVSLPLGTTAPVLGTGDLKLKAHITPVGQTAYDTPASTIVVNHNRVLTSVDNPASPEPAAAQGLVFQRGLENAGMGWGSMRYDSGLAVDLTNATAATISALRLAIQTQEILEHDMRNGVRYTEMLEGRWGCVNPDLQLYRPQYLGGTKTPLLTTPVVQTSGTGTTGQNTPQGNLAGYASKGDGGQVIRASFGEFGHIMGLIAVTATPQYQYGCHRKFTRYERFDYMYPEFQGLSDQAILNKELYAQDDTITDSITGGAVNDEPWGYIGRYDEYRYFNNEICGALRSNYATSLDVWTYAENMSNLQNLNGDFIKDKSDVIVKRSMAIQTEGNTIEDQFLLDCLFTGAVTRVLTSKAVPQTGGRIL